MNLIWLLMFYLTLQNSDCAQSQDFIVEIEQGKLRGMQEEDFDGNKFISFQGIPYAKPPIGSLRFKDPQKPNPWKDDVFNATYEGMACNYHLNGPFLKLKLPTSEDCLTLNIFTRDILKNDTQKLKAVMVFIYGGAFSIGSSSRFLYGPEFLMTQDIVLVTFNYRLGPFGFLRFKDPSLGPIGNAAMKDMVQALKWVKKNIRQFGGDPNSVTIFGESAGSASVEYLTLSPLAKGLFHRAIMQSGSALNPWALGTGDWQDLIKGMNYSGSNDEKSVLKYLQNLQPDSILDAVKFELSVSQKRPFCPTIEAKSKNAFLAEHPKSALLSGNYNQVPMIIGYNSFEGLLVKAFKILGITVNVDDPVPYTLGFEKFSKKYNETFNKLVQFYFGSSIYDKNNEIALCKAAGDLALVHGIHQSINIRSKTSTQPIYVYKMTVESDLNKFKKAIANISTPGVCHADDIGYLFQTAMGSVDEGSVEETLFRRFVTMWANFAKTGNPTPKKDPLLNVEWKPIVNGDLNYLDIGQELVMKKNPDIENMKFLDTTFNM